MRVGACDVEGLLFDLDGDADISLTQARDWLSASERARAGRFKFQIHRDRFTRGRGFLRQTLAACLGQPDPGALAFALGPQGKPALEGERIWFNLSHCEDRAVMVISGDGPLGVDIERHDRSTDILALAPSVFTQAECDRLESQPDDAARRRFFFRLWTAKEARMKLTGEGMSLNPKQISLQIEGDLPVGYAQPEMPKTALAYLSGLAGASCAVAAPRQL